MARPLRIEYPGAVYHITSRGDRREPIFSDDGDRESVLSVLAHVVDRFDWICHGFCLMDNHYHLLLDTPRPNLAQGMRQLNGVYTQRFNARHDKTGHVFQGRYGAVLVEKDSHLLAACRYVVMNPVRAKAVRSPGDWAWSSYRATAGLAACPDWLCTEWLLSKFGQSAASARRAYREFVQEGRETQETFWGSVAGGIILGSQEFAEKALQSAGMRRTESEMPKRERLAARPDLASLLGPLQGRSRHTRDKAIATAFAEHGYRMKEIAACLGIHYSTVSRAISRGEGPMLDCRT